MWNVNLIQFFDNRPAFKCEVIKILVNFLWITYKQHKWYYCGTSDVNGVEDGGGGGTQWWSITALGLGFQVLLFIFNQIQQDDFSAAWPSFLTVVFLSHPFTPRAEYYLASGNIPCLINFVSTFCQEFIICSLFLSLAFRHLSSRGTASLDYTFIVDFQLLRQIHCQLPVLTLI